tara:strand:- start:12520 stop:14163 length:1644 start_codon:yes stop_codon:yes gene_type:complete
MILAVFVALLELSTIVSIFPFLSVVSSPEIIQENEYLNYFYNFLDLETENDFIFLLGISVIGVFLLRGIFSMMLTVSRMIFTRYFHVNLSNKLFQHYLNIEYKEFSKRQSSSATEILVNETLYVANSVNDLIVFLTEVILIFLIVSTLIFIDWKITSITILTFAFLTILTIPITRILAKRGVERAETQLAIYDLLSEALSNFKAIKILSSSSLFTRKLLVSLDKFAKNQVWYVSIAELPKYFIEITALTFLIALILSLNNSNTETSTWLPLISTLAMAFYRLLPSINRIISTFNQLKYNKRATEVVLREFSIPQENIINKEEEINFKQDLVFEDISLKYKDKTILSDLSLQIKSGEKIAITGPSGSGKSSFLDIIMGIIKPNKGRILIDGQPLTSSHLKSWRSKIGYVPQNNYLLNASVEENISFGRKVEKEKIDKSLKLANLDMDSLFNNLDRKNIGEGGVQLSGGQKQRLMIGRASYMDPSIIILDEPTSALDSDTEERVMKEIFDSFRDKTIVIVSHRDEAIKGCDRYLKLENGRFIELPKKAF